MHVLAPSITGANVPIKIWGDPVALDENLKQQMIQVASLPNVFSHTANMPDSHLGKGVNIGCVVAIKRAVIPNAVGVDIGCGMCAWNTGVKKANFPDKDFHEYMKQVVQNVPTGFAQRKMNDPWLDHDLIVDKIDAMEVRLAQLETDFSKPMPVKWHDKIRLQIGTLGGGNHFWEVQIDNEDNLWIMIHSGSRGLGARVADEAHETARAMCAKWHAKLPTEQLAFLPDDSKEGKDYIARMLYAQDYALLNREMMLFVGQMLLRDMVGTTNNRSDFINIHHNFAKLENHFGENVWVHRKGATPARVTTTGIIPGSMCSKSYIVTGKDNPQSFSSCSHGAGRRFSRTEAKKRVAAGTDPPQESQLGSVKLYGTRHAQDELASAYKDIDDVMSHQGELVNIKLELKPLAVIKGDSKEARD